MTVKIHGLQSLIVVLAFSTHCILDKDVSLEYFSEYLWLKTNDPQAKQIPVLVEGQVQAAVSVSPASLFLGVVKPGETVTKQLVVRGQAPFRIASIEADCQCFQAVLPVDVQTKTLYLVPITFTAGEKPGKITHTLSIQTDLGDTVLEVPAYAVISR